MKFLFPFLLLLASHSLVAQIDSTYLRTLYRHGMDMSEEKVDSIKYFADIIEKISEKSHYVLGQIYSLRLEGFYFENKGEYEKAIDYYLQTLDEARKVDNIEIEVSALTDLAAVYTSDLDQAQKAKEVYLECVALNKRRGNVRSLLATYTNLGAIYNKLGMHDSALALFNEGLRLGKPLEAQGKYDMSTLYNNIGNAYFLKNDFDQALFYFRKNHTQHKASGSLDDIWLDELNLADAYIGKNMMDSANKFAHSSLAIAKELGSKSKEADSYSILSKYYQHKGEFRTAFEYLQEWYKLDTSLVNAQTYKAIAVLQEKFHARERENEKLVLEAEIANEKFDNRIIMVTAIGLLIVVGLIATAFFIKRNANRKLLQTNDLILRQNEKLSELNFEKNSLISIVSHDLSTPFASIGMWSQLLDNDKNPLSEEQQKAISKIRQSTSYGEKLIRRILDVEKAQTNQQKINIENFDLKIFVEEIVESFKPSAEKKSIRMITEMPQHSVYLLSDRQMVSRICENLLSNAIKYSDRGKNVWVSISEEKDAVSIKIRDEGQGIEKEELPYLFSKYNKISSIPTEGEASTGLGLSIVKRIVEELNGHILCESEKAKGSLFTVILKR